MPMYVGLKKICLDIFTTQRPTRLACALSDVMVPGFFNHLVLFGTDHLRLHVWMMMDLHTCVQNTFGRCSGMWSMFLMGAVRSWGRG